MRDLLRCVLFQVMPGVCLLKLWIGRVAGGFLTVAEDTLQAQSSERALGQLDAHRFDCTVRNFIRALSPLSQRGDGDGDGLDAWVRGSKVPGGWRLPWLRPTQ